MPRSFLRGQVCHDRYFAAYQGFGFVGFRDAGYYASRFGFADVDVEVQEFVGFRDCGGVQDYAYAQIDFQEIVDGDRRRRFRLRYRFAKHGLLAGVFFDFQFFHFFDGDFWVGSGEDCRRLCPRLDRRADGPSADPWCGLR